ncbi:MAG: polysulfide reductase NrfD [Candidatus Kapabacteria bacterium]|nr:polysulfide reductase NrfD [Candidatus Kapabacteria bacterium]
MPEEKQNKENNDKFVFLTKLAANSLNNGSSGYYRVLLTVSIVITLFAIVGVYLTTSKGLKLWGINNSIPWALDITNFVFWIGISHAGSLISAILFLLRQHWRAGIHRIAEAMTIFALFTAIIYPIFHTGRPWLTIFWVFPVPIQSGVWVNFKSPLMWDVFAILIYLISSIIFLYIGLLPDLAILSKKVKSVFLQKIYSFLSSFWIGSSKQWKNYKATYLVIAGLITPLVLSVHSIVSFDFAVSLVPGWHTTIMPPYFVAGAIFSGCASLVVLLIIFRKLFNLEEIISVDVMEKVNKLMLVSGLMLAYSYLTEYFFLFYGANPFENQSFSNRFIGDYKYVFWSMFAMNIIFPQLLWVKKIRRSIPFSLFVSVFVLLGMWLERYSIIVPSLAKDYISSSWDVYFPTLTEISILIGSFGLFMTLFLLFLRFFPIFSIYDLSKLNSNKKNYD